MNVTVLGDGAWGCACATVLANNGHTVTLWCHNKDVADQIRATQYNTRYLPGVKLQETITPTTDIPYAIEHAQWIFEAIPVTFLRSILGQCTLYSRPDQRWIVLSKGIENNSLYLPADILNDVFGYSVPSIILSGPSFAYDVARQQITTVMLACQDYALAQQVQKIIANSYFIPYITDDVIGVQLCGALKNCVALAIGLLEGAGYTDNPKASLLTQGLQEIASISQTLGGTHRTAYGLAGVGDIILTATGSKSKNLQVGRQIGQGKKIQDIISSGASLPEGINTLISTYQLIRKYNLHAPLIAALYAIIFENKPVSSILPQEVMVA
jgi:glycerol-3-phosphate dehydrogenase (NAD(P)+)